MGGDILREVIEQIKLANDSLVADAHSQGQSHILTGEFNHLINQHTATLADDSHTALIRPDKALSRQEKGVELPGNIDPETIGANEWEISFIGDVRQTLL